MPTFPTSGTVLATWIDALGLRERVIELTEGSDRTLERIAANERVSSGNFEKAARGLAAAFFPDELIAALRITDDLDYRWQRGVGSVLLRLFGAWDTAVGDLGSGSPAVTQTEAVLTWARVASVDLAIRGAFFRAARGLGDPSGDALRAIVEGRLFAHTVAVELKARRWSRDELARRLAAGLSGASEDYGGESTLDTWLQGEHLPRGAALPRLAAALGAEGPGAVVLLELDLRLARAADFLWRLLADATSPGHAGQWAARCVSLCGRVFPIVRELPPHAAWASVITGPGGKLGRGMTLFLSQLTMTPFEQRTILATMDDWTPVVREAIANLAHPDELVARELARAGMDPALRHVTRQWFLLPPDVSTPPKLAAQVRAGVYGDRDDPHVLDELAGVATAAGDPQASLPALQRLADGRPDDVRVRFRLGCSLGQLGHLDQALHQLQRVLELDPDHFLARVERGLAYLNVGKAAEAVRVIERAFQAQPEVLVEHEAHGRYGLGLALQAAGNLPRAEQELSRVTELDPGHARGWEALGRVKLALGDALGAKVPARQADHLGRPQLLEELDGRK